MTDVHAPEVRRKNMQAIRGRDTKPEILFRRALFKAGVRYRLDNKHLPGNPDIYISKTRTAVFIHGCFWHAHQCPLFRVPATRTEFWCNKLAGNVERDQRNLKLLQENGYSVLVIWECALKGKLKLSAEQLLADVIQWLGQSGTLAVADTEGFTDVRKTERCIHRCCGKVPYGS